MAEEYYGYNAKQHKMKTILIDNLLLCAMIHKHESFSAEQEVRLSPYFVKEDDAHITYRILKTIRRIYVMDLNELCQKENVDMEDLISSIVIGPKSEQNIEDLKWYLRKIGLPRLAEKVQRSNCPLK